MKRRTDDEALSWGDENDPTYVAPDLDDADDARERGTAPATTTVAAAYTAPAASPDPGPAPRQTADPTDERAPKQPGGIETAAAAEHEASEPLSSASLITFAFFAGILFLYTIGWFVGFLRNPPTGAGLGGIVQAVLAVLTIFAPALWFVGTLSLGRASSVRIRILWLLIGVIVLVPWPFVTGY